MSLIGYVWGWRSLGIARGDLVLEVGSGNRPRPRSDVLCDIGDYGDGARYAGSTLSDVVRDRPFVYGDAERLPFRDHSFDFLLSAHAIEHMPRPDRFLAEAARVSARGCIIAPSEPFELMVAEATHLWYLHRRDGTLVIRAKEAGDEGPFGDLFQRLWGESADLRRLLLSRTDVFEVRHAYRDGHIDFEIQGEAPAAREAAPEPMPSGATLMRQQVVAWVRSILGLAIRRAFSDAKPDLDRLLRCPVCGADVTVTSADRADCGGCGRRYPMRGPDPVMLASEAREA